MKKIALALALMFGFLLLSTPALANNSNEVKTIEELHNMLLNKELISLNDDKKLIISQDANNLEIDSSLFDDYKKRIESANFAVGEGIAWYDENLQITFLPDEEITEKVYQNYQIEKSLGLSGPISTMATVLDVKTMMDKNYRAVNSINTVGRVTIARAYWVGKVREGGAWDYKVVKGFSPWYKTFSMVLPNGSTETHNSKWLGNYNYGYTGRVVFNKTVLLIGGDLVGLGKNQKPDDAQAKDAIRRGYDHANSFQKK
ncbi:MULTISPECIES: polymorphic toxin type 44 domain-containing protein [Bacillota]|uniref:Uncharacterized protein n=1 Tax=Niallia circulans TaxID=1397 RepID=A0A268FC25_NIACI|nr:MULTISPECIES: polymorphic toxin type 44 domain-containing protein [Bacillota]AYV67614.1 hypothetical protein C2I06_12460 [Niallia circulans]NRG29836.1 hypothetical protein [Niallia circulans]PAD82919.1 hypothetical protein CHH57_12420 [Niallia circulans]